VPFKVAQIAKEGTLKNFEFPRTTSSHRSLLSFFCDDQYLYILATGEGHELDDAKRGQEKLILNRYSHENQDHQVYEIDADPLPDDNNTVFWQYAGQVDGLHYLISKSLVPNEPKTIAALTGFNPEGEVKIKKTITETLINKWQRPVKMYDDDMFYSNLQNFDFYETGGSTLSEAQTAGGFMGFKVDPLHKCFYVYGLLGAKPFKRIAAEYDGFYINKYDLNGNPVWRMERTGDEELGGERIFHRGAAPAHRSIVLKSLPDGRLNVNIAWMKTEVEHDISATGEVLGLRSRENVWVHTQSSFDGTGQSAAAKFVKSQTDAGKNINYGIFATSKSDIVIRMNEKDPDLELYFFNK
jgi:hypothetical protein